MDAIIAEIVMISGDGQSYCPVFSRLRVAGRRMLKIFSFRPVTMLKMKCFSKCIL